MNEKLFYLILLILLINAFVFIWQTVVVKVMSRELEYTLLKMKLKYQIQSNQTEIDREFYYFVDDFISKTIASIDVLSLMTFILINLFFRKNIVKSSREVENQLNSFTEKQQKDILNISNLIEVYIVKKSILLSIVFIIVGLIIVLISKFSKKISGSLDVFKQKLFKKIEITKVISNDVLINT